VTKEHETRSILVIGAGTMGHGIAQAAAQAGYLVMLHDVDPSYIETGLANIRTALDRRVIKGRMTPDDMKRTLDRVHAAPDLQAAAGRADLAIEAVPEILDLKRKVFGALDAACPSETILASNTSSLPLTRIAEATGRPDRVVGMHFFNPVPVMPLVEIIRTPSTGAGAIEAVREVAETMGKETIVVSDSPGFASSRLGIALGLEAMRMLEEGVASAADIDRAMELGYNHPMGPLRLTDLVGLDVRLAIAEHLARELDGTRFRPPEILRRKVAEGKLGKKTGEGFHRWDEPGG